MHQWQQLKQFMIAVPNFQSALGAALTQVCEDTNWDYGEAWIPLANNTVIELSQVWYSRNVAVAPLDVSALKQFRCCSEGLALPLNIGLPGRVWYTQQAEWIVNLKHQPESKFIRGKIAHACGFKTALGIPIVVQHQVLAILVFMTSRNQKEDWHLTERMKVLLSSHLVEFLPCLATSSTVGGEALQIVMSHAQLDGVQHSNAGFANALVTNKHSGYDPLTGLANRTYFMEHIRRRCDLANTPGVSYKFAVLFLDLDRFKVINDCLGYSLGDQLLVAIATRIQTYLRPSDTIARLGGDEFAILLDNIDSETEATHIAKQICAAIASPFIVAGHEVFAGVSIGIAFSQTQATCLPEDLLRYADLAMCDAKQLVKGRYMVFEEAMHDRAVARWQLENDLRQAVQEIIGDRVAGNSSTSVAPSVVTSQSLDFSAGEAKELNSTFKLTLVPRLRRMRHSSRLLLANQLRLYYQPVVSVTTHQPMGFEALLRWRHPQRGWVSPDKFIPIAEETGMILPLGEWVLWQACRQLRHWQDQFPHAPLVMSVNVSCKQLSSSDLVETIDRILHTYSLAGSSLKLEITETVLMENTQAIAQTLEQLKSLDVKLSIDDFGIGYSSLSRLHAFPIDTLKIDRSFISGEQNLDENSQIVQTIVALAHQLGMDVVAEGVETTAQLAHLKALRCEYAQGYLFSQPVDSNVAEELMTQKSV